MVAAGNGIFAGGKTAPIERAVVDRFAVGGAVVRATVPSLSRIHQPSAVSR